MVNDSVLNENFSVVAEENPWSELNVPYTVSEVLVSIAAIIGNSLVIVVYWRDRRLRRRTKYYIISLAIADLLVGVFGIPFAILASVGLPHNIYLCLFNMSLLVVLCTISIFCLVAVSVDRYWAILHPMSYSRKVRSRTAIEIIIVCWLAGAVVGFLPLFGWNEGGPIDRKCFFVEVMNYNYLVFLYFATIIAPAVLLAAFYAHIYRVVLQQVRQMVTLSPGSSFPAKSSGGMLRVLGAVQKREVKATQNLSVIVLFFIICWFPLYTINFVKAFCRECNINPTLTNCCIILSHLNSSFNPFLYAYHLKDFRVALHDLIFGNNPLQVRIPKSPYLRRKPEISSGNNANTSVYFFKDEVAKTGKSPKEPQAIFRQFHSELWTEESRNRFPMQCLLQGNSALLYEEESDEGVFVSYGDHHECERGNGHKSSDGASLEVIRCRSFSTSALRTGETVKRHRVTSNRKKAIKSKPWSCDDLRIVNHSANGIIAKL